MHMHHHCKPIPTDGLLDTANLEKLKILDIDSPSVLLHLGDDKVSMLTLTYPHKPPEGG